ncbi:MAG: packaged DNA stabilization gp4 family protein [Candidatus Bathyarchaeota archaeon]|jgi:hypothetical protein
MSWTKKDIIESAFDSIGLSGHSFDLQPEEYESALRKLDTMMATWNGKGIRLGYPIPSGPNSSDISDDSFVPDWSLEAIYLNLAIRIAPSFGKMIHPDVKASSKEAYDSMMQRLSTPPEYQVSGVPKGQGSKSWRYSDGVFIPEQDQPLTDGSNDTLDFY